MLECEYFYIKNFNLLDKDELNLTKEYAKNHENSDSEIFTDLSGKKIYDFGNGMYFAFSKSSLKSVIGKVFTVLESAKPLGTAYIHNLSISPDVKKQLTIKLLESLVNQGIKCAIENGATDIRLGNRNVEMEGFLQESIFGSYEYRAYIMELSKERIDCENPILDLKLITEKDSLYYTELYNNSFAGAPHRDFMTTKTALDYAKKNIEDKDKSFYCIASKSNTDCGFLNITVDDGVGSFDLGILKLERGLGYGKAILETAINFLKSKEVTKIQLIVIEENKLALDMYQNRGFEIIETLGFWRKIKPYPEN